MLSAQLQFWIFYTTLLLNRSLNTEHACRLSLIKMTWIVPILQIFSMHILLNICICSMVSIQ